MDKALFVQNVKNLCERKGVKPTVACRDSGAGKDFLNQIVTRGQTPSVEKVQQLAQYLGVTVSDLLGETQPPHDLHDVAGRGRASDMVRLTVAEIETILAYRRADERDKRLVDVALEPYKKGTASGAV